MKLFLLILENCSICNVQQTIRRIIPSFLTPKTELRHLCRWTLDNDINKINQKIDLSNYDHCGSCGSPQQSSNLDDMKITKKDMKK
jgi:hypothetical protein